MRPRPGSSNSAAKPISAAANGAWMGEREVSCVSSPCRDRSRAMLRAARRSFKSCGLRCAPRCDPAATAIPDLRVRGRGREATRARPPRARGRRGGLRRAADPRDARRAARHDLVHAAEAVALRVRRGALRARRVRLGPALPDRAGDVPRGPRGRGPALRATRRLRLRRDRGRPRSARQRPRARRQHDLAAGRQEPVPVAGAELAAEGGRGLAHGVDRAALAEAADPRGLRQRRAVRPVHLRRRRRQPPLLRHRAVRAWTSEQAALLAAVLPNPVERRADAPSPKLRERAAWIARQARNVSLDALSEPEASH